MRPHRRAVTPICAATCASGCSGRQGFLPRCDGDELRTDLANLGVGLLKSQLLHVAVRSPEATIKDEGEGSRRAQLCQRDPVPLRSFDNPALFEESTRTIRVEDLPARWRSYPAPEELAALGTDRVARGTSVALSVPSALVPSEHNYLLNPAHPDFARVRVGGGPGAGDAGRARPGATSSSGPSAAS